MPNHTPARSIRRWRKATPVLALVPLAALGMQPAEHYLDGKLHALVASQLGSTLGRRTEFGALHLTGHGAVLDGIRVIPSANERVEPLRVRHASVGIDWWHLVRTRQLRVTEVALDGVSVRVSPDEFAPHGSGTPGAPWTAQIAGLGRTGLARVSVRDGSVELFAGTRTPSMRADSVRGELRLGGATFAFGLHADSMRGNGLAASALDFTGEGDARQVTVREARADAFGGTVRAHGTVHAASGEVAIEVQGERLSLDGLAQGELASQLRGARTDGTMSLEMHAGVLTRVYSTLHAERAPQSNALAWTSARAGIEWTPSAGASITGLSIATPALHATADGTLTVPTGTPFADAHLHTSGTLSADGAGLHALAALAHASSTRWNAKRANASFTLDGTLDDLAHASLQGHVRVDELALHVRREIEPLALSRLEGDVTRAPSGLVSLRAVHAQAHGVRADADVTLVPGRGGRFDHFTADGTLAVDGVSPVQRLLPGSSVWNWIGAQSERTHSRAQFHAHAALADPSSLEIDGEFDTHALRVGIPAPAPVLSSATAVSSVTVPVEHATGRFAISVRDPATGEPRIVLEDVHATGPRGDVSSGHAEIAGREVRVSVAAERVDPSVVRWAVPGRIEGGLAHGTLQLEFTRGEPLRAISGRFELDHARYYAPRAIGWNETPLAVSKLTGEFAMRDDRTQIRALTLHSDRGDATADISTEPGLTHIRADVSVADLGRMVDAWPALHGVVHSGRGTGHLDLRVDARGVHGAASVTGDGGSLHLPSVPAEFANQPVGHVNAEMAFGPDGITVQRVALRSEQINLDLGGVIHDDATVTGHGRAWFTRGYTSQVLTGVRWFTRLLGVRELGTDFTLSGRKDRLLINAGITHTLLWRLGKGRLSRDVQDIARGAKPILG